MSEQFKVFVNKAVFASNDNETMITLYIERPFMNPKSVVEITREELGTIIFTHEYAVKFREALDTNLKTQVENREKARKVSEVEVK